MLESLFHTLKGAFSQADKACVRHRESMFRPMEKPVPAFSKLYNVIQNQKYAH